MNVKTHRSLLDAFGNLELNVKNIEKSWAEINKLKKLLDTEYKRKDLVENKEFLSKSIREISELELDQNELESIESRRDSLKKSSQSSSVIHDTLQSLNRELVEESIMNAIKSLERLEKKGQIDDQLLIELFYAASEKFSQACEMLDQLREKSCLLYTSPSPRD